MTTPHDDLRARLLRQAAQLRGPSAGETIALLQEAAAALSALPAASEAAGAMDRSAPERVWLQVNTDGDNDDRSEAIPRDSWEHLSWYHEPIGGQEVEYIRADLATPQPAPAQPVEALLECVPSNWCDPLLTGMDGLGTPPYDCFDIERLLKGIRERLIATPQPAPALVEALRALAFQMIGDSRDGFMSDRWRAACEHYGAKLTQIIATASKESE